MSNDLNKPRRNYIRRKRCLTESVNLIETTLHFILTTRGEEIDISSLKKQASQHAHEVEAACWAPRTKMTDDEYNQLTLTKTKALCLLLINKFLPYASLKLTTDTEKSANDSKPPLNKSKVIEKPIEVALNSNLDGNMIQDGIMEAKYIPSFTMQMSRDPSFDSLGDLSLINDYSPPSIDVGSSMYSIDYFM